MNLARLDGALAIADSEHRERWGLDGYHASLAIDGNPDGRGAGARTTSWVSDNWEVTHALAVVFPRRVNVSAVRVTWAGPNTPLAPRTFTVLVRADGHWQEVASIEPTPGEATTAAPVVATDVTAVAIEQPADAAGPGTDRRLWIAELEIEGEPVQPARAVDGVALAAAIREEWRARRSEEDAARVRPQLDRVMAVRKTRGFQSLIDREDLERGRRNVVVHPWAKRYAERVLRDADWWVAKPDEWVAGLIPEGNPRAICPSFERGCPLHGGARGSFTATIEAPYRWKCRQGGEEWFDGAEVTNPGTGTTVTVRDDGSGWLAPEGFPNAGRRYYFTAAYRYFLLGKLFASPYEGDGGSEYRGGTPVLQLALAYAISGEPKYAHTCAVMLNRLAELYRTYDGCVEGPSQRQDGYIGQTFERFLVQNLILACDLIWDELEADQALHDFFAARGDTDYDGDGRVTGADFTYNLQCNLLGYVYEYLHRLMPYMDGDFLMYELTGLAALAHCLGNPDLAAEALESDLGLRVLLGNSWFRDGKYIYDSTGYNLGNARTPLLIAEWLHGLVAPPTVTVPFDGYHDPDYRVAMLYDFIRHIDCDGRVPQIGDVGGARTMSLRVDPPWGIDDERALLRLPEQREFYLNRLLAASRGQPDALREGLADGWLLFHAEDVPAGDAPPPEPPTSHLFDDSGIAILRAGADANTRLHVPFTFSKGNYGHGHTDKLAINLFRFGYDWSADLGYPTTWTDPKYGNWETDTASHCLVVLDGAEQRPNVIGQLEYYATSPLVDVCEATALEAYPNATDYRRTVALVRDETGEPLYVVDLFRAAGATVRDYRFHSLGRPEDCTIELDDPAANWRTQPAGSLAGEDVAPMSGRGDSYLFDLERASTAGAAIATWRPAGETSQPDRYLLTARAFRRCVVEFTLTRTGRASGERERAVFVYATQPGATSNRRVIMIPVEQLAVGQPARVRVEIDGAEARMTIDGRSVGRVDVAGSPADQGSLGLLHYYNYAWEYRDFRITDESGELLEPDFDRPLDPAFWARIDPTYTAGDGHLSVADHEALGLRLHLLGAPGQEIIKARAEGYGVRGRSPFEAHLIARRSVADPAVASVFAAVIEPFRIQPRVAAVEAVNLTGGGATALRVTVSMPEGEPRVDSVFCALDPEVSHDATVDGVAVEFAGRYGFVATRAGRIVGMTLVGGGALRFGGEALADDGAFAGQIESTAGPNSLLVRAEGGRSPAVLVGGKLKVTNDRYRCPSVYTIEAVERVGELWRLQLNLPLAVARGIVRATDPDTSAFASQTPVMKLRVNPGLFDGRIAVGGSGRFHRLNTATEAAFVLTDPAALVDFAPGAAYTILDVGPGDRVEVIPCRSR